MVFRAWHHFLQAFLSRLFGVPYDEGWRGEQNMPGYETFLRAHGQERLIISIMGTYHWSHFEGCFSMRLLNFGL